MTKEDRRSHPRDQRRQKLADVANDVYSQMPESMRDGTVVEVIGDRLIVRKVSLTKKK